VDYSRLRPGGRILKRTGGIASGPLPLMYSVNEIGRNVIQGGSRRSAIYASLNWKHEDIPEFLRAKDWYDMRVDGTNVGRLKEADFSFPAPLDMTNISVNYDDSWLNNEERHLDPVFVENCRQALSTGEPGFSFNFGDKQNETLRNAPISATTRVLTSWGYKDVGEIVDTEIVVWTGKQWATTIFKRTGTRVETVRVTLSNGRYIDCDPCHPFVLWSKGGELRVEAQNLSAGQSVVCDLPLDENPTVGSDYGWGFVWGDGWVGKGRGEFSVFADNKRRCFEQAKTELGAVGEDTARFKCSFNTKPFFINPSFVAGWFDADGCYCRGTLRLSSTDVNKLLQLQEKLDDWGIKSVVRRDGKCNYGTDNPCYTLGVWKESHNRFAEVIPTLRVTPSPVSGVRKQNIKVIDVEPSGYIEDVYCCDVGVEEHAFMAEGVIISNCTEVTSEDDSDVCNLGSVNLGAIDSIEELADVVRLASKFLVCGTLRAELPYEKVYEVRERNRRLGLGIMGLHEWLLKRGYNYSVPEELHKWLEIYRDESEKAANEHCDRFFISRPVAYRAIAPTGTIGILAGTTTGIEPLYAVAYKRRYLSNGNVWNHQIMVDSTAQQLIDEYGLDPSAIETATTLSTDIERRIRVQAEVQHYVDMAISSTINLPEWGSASNSEDGVLRFAKTLSEYAPRLRGFTVYPDGARGGQPITSIPFEEAAGKEGVIYEENGDVCKGGICGV